MFPGGGFFSPQSMFMPQQAYMQTPQMAVQQQQGPDSKRQKVTTAVIPLTKMPNKHKVESIEAVAPELDPTLTGNLQADELTIILFVLTRVRSDMKLQDLRVEYYDDITRSMAKAASRLKDKSPPEYRAMTDALIALLSDPKETSETKSDQLLDLGLHHGFQIAWLRKKPKQEKGVKTKSIADRMEEMAARKKLRRNDSAPEAASPTSEPSTAVASSAPAASAGAAPAAPAAPLAALALEDSAPLQTRPAVLTPFMVAARLAARRQQLRQNQEAQAPQQQQQQQNSQQQVATLSQAAAAHQDLLQQKP